MAKNDFFSDQRIDHVSAVFLVQRRRLPGQGTVAIRAINETVPLLTRLAASLSCRRAIAVKSDSFPTSPDERAAASELMRSCMVYGPILKDRESIRGVLKISLGTNNTDVVSNMGPGGKPGASLRAFRDFLGSAVNFGADIDRRILFQEDRIKTFFVDQQISTALPNWTNRYRRRSIWSSMMAYVRRTRIWRPSSSA